MTNQERRIITSFHESGHAVFGALVRRAIEFVTIKANEHEGYHGLCQLRESHLFAEQLGGGRSYDGPCETPESWAKMQGVERYQMLAMGRARSMMVDLVGITFAGPLAVRVRWPVQLRENFWQNPHNGGDREAAVDGLLWLGHGQQAASNVARRLEAHVTSVLRKPAVWESVQSLAAELQRRERITGRRVRDVVRAHIDPESPIRQSARPKFLLELAGS